MGSYEERLGTLSSRLERNDMLKLVALFTMLIDHIGYQLYPGVMIYRIIGRIAFPIFAYQIALGYRKTSNLSKYYMRLLTFSVISQIPYVYFSPGRLNIFPTLTLGLLVIHLYEKNMKALTVMLVILGDVLNFQYGSYGIVMILLFHIFYNRNEKTIISIVALNLLYYKLSGGSIQIFSTLSLLFIQYDFKIKVKMNKFIGYWFYPVHIAIIVCLRYYIWK